MDVIRDGLSGGHQDNTQDKQTDARQSMVRDGNVVRLRPELRRVPHPGPARFDDCPKSAMRFALGRD